MQTSKIQSQGALNQKMEEGERETPSCRHEAGLGLGTALRGLLLTFSTPGGKTPVNVDMGYVCAFYS